MFNTGVNEQIIDTIKLLLTEAQTSDEVTRCQLILQTNQFFPQVLKNAKKTSKFFSSLVQASCQFIKIMTPNLKLFLVDDEKAKVISTIMTMFLNSCVAENTAQDMSFFVISFAFNDFSQLPSTKVFEPFLLSFFSNPLFAVPFEVAGGLLALWELLMNENKSYLCGIIFPEITKTIHLYFQSDNPEPAVAFLQHVNANFMKIPETNVFLSFQFLFDLIFHSRHHLLFKFIEIGGFKTINKYILEKNDPQLIIVYQMFRPMCTEMPPNSVVHPIIAELFSLIITKNVTKDVKIAALTQLYQAIGQFPRNQCPIRPKDLHLLGISFKNDKDSLLLFFRICSVISSTYDFDMTPTFPDFQVLCTFKLAIENDVQILFEMFKKIGNKFTPYSLDFFSSLTNSITNDEFKGLIKKYPIIVGLLSNCFLGQATNEKLLHHIFSFVPNLNIKENTLVSLILKSPTNIEILLNFLKSSTDAAVINALFKFMIHIFASSSMHRSIFNNLHCLQHLATVKAPPGLIFDLFVSLSGRHFSVLLDRDVAEFLKSVNFFQMSTDSIYRLAFAIFQNSPITNPFLVFPSILSRCGDFKITSPYDMWLCGQYGIETWLKETGKKIDEFPCIVDIAQRYILPKHVQIFFEFPKLFSESCSDIFGSTPLFEFPKDLIHTKISIPVSNEIRSISFWFFFKEYPPASQNICTFNNISFYATGNELFINKKLITEYPINRWYHVVISMTDRMAATVFLNARNVFTATASQSGTMIFGGDKNPGYWFLGGAIRLYKTTVPQPIVEKLYNRGVRSVIKLDENTEHNIITPTTFIPLFNDPKQSEWLSENSRPVPSFSFIYHINHAYRGGTCPLTLIFQRLQEKKIEECTHLLNALCSLQQLGYSSWAPNIFAVRMSAIFLLCPQLFDSNTFTNVLSCFTSDLTDTIMWDSILSFLLDFSLFNSSHKSFIISKMFEYVAQFSIDDKISTMLAHFIFHVLELVDCDESDSDALLALIYKIKPSSNQVARLIASLPDFKDHFSNPTMKYKPVFEGHIYQTLLDYILRNPEGFTHYYLVYIIPLLDAIKLIMTLIPGKIPLSDRQKMLYYFLSKTAMKESWDVIISLIVNNKVNVQKNALFNFKVEHEFHHLLIVYLSFVGIHALNNKDDQFYHKLWPKMLKLTISIIPDIQDLSRSLLFAIDQLLSFGKLSRFLSVFPFVPSLTDPEKIADFALSEGQPFPETRSKNDTHPTFPNVDSIVEETRNKVLGLLPEKRYLLPPNSDQFITSHREKYTESFIDETVKANTEVYWADWNAIMPPRTFKIEAVEKSSYMRDSLKLSAAIILNVISKPDIFKSGFVHVMLNNALMNTKLSIYIFRSLFFEICQQCIIKKVFDQFIVNFICFSIGEGWFKNKIIEVLGIMLNLLAKVESPVSRTFGTYIILSFSLIQKSQVPDLLKLFVTYRDLIFSKESLKREQFIFMLFDRLKTYVDEFKEHVVPVCQIFADALPPLINVKDEKCEENLIYNYLILALKMMAKSGAASLNQLSLDEPELDSFFREKYEEVRESFDERLRQNVVKNLTVNADRRIKLATIFFQQADELTRNANNSIVQNISISSIIRFHEREMLLFDEDNFLRMRERLLTPHQYFKVSLTKTKTLSLLSDPVYPTRRLEKSPMLYKIPEFPAVNVTDVSPDLPFVEEQLTILPSILTGQLEIDYQPYEILMMHSPNQLNLTFSYHFEIDDWLLLAILQNTVNRGEKFLFLENVSLLYGLDPLSGVVMLNENYMFFVEGLRATETGIRFAPSTMPNALYSFYISYMISGYFGQCYLFSGHPILQLPKSLIVSCTPHLWLQEPISVEVNFLFGWSFIMIAESSKVFKKLGKFLSDTVDTNYSFFPPPSNVPSPIRSGRLLRSSLKELSKDWVDESLDNFTYLCCLNRLGSRSFLDFSQYFVFPWVFSEYKEVKDVDDLPTRPLNLPMGQIGQDRLERFDSIFEDSGTHFYGTHYMHLGVVLFYLFRNDPFCLFSIYFHHGYDHPNRVFHDIPEAWNSAAIMHPTDVKEIVPQMFCVPEFLTNTSSLPLTSTTDGRPVDNVTLAKWATNPRDFIYKQRYALESEKISLHINEWIDLIFGYKSRGEASVEAKNVYQPLCYPESKESGADYDENDAIDREAAITCIINFGQCAKQLFKSPHQVRTKSFLVKTHIMTDPSKLTHQRINPKEFTWPIGDVSIQGSNICTASNVSKLLFGSLIRYSSQRGAMVKQKESGAPVIPLFDAFNSIDFFVLSPDGAVAVLFQKEGSFTVYTLTYEKGEVNGGRLMMRLQTLSNVYSASVSTLHFLIVASCGETVQRFDLGLQAEVEPIQVGFFARRVAIDDKAALIIIGGDKELGIWSISGQFLMKKNIDSPVSVIAVSGLDEYIKNRFFITGHLNGYVQFWAVDYTNNEIIQLKSTKIFNRPVLRISIDDDSRRAVATSWTEMYVFDYFGSNAPQLKKEYAIECSNCGEVLTQKPKICSHCHRFYCSKCDPQSPNKLCLQCNQIQSYDPGAELVL
ncbi:hypothetical protein TRFO_34673 [Tritrichomonas foetus]|uniref:BEACH domain-containing protein n=1 Tax=Tritrichomonas foetus TaxID=1144522 RepID=A0A1J4JK37_9EUKA|nr:hypothetical protein TRFO_34673 [Tritrichomonas foetus]|eukprot:OHS98977.1 hypothetical protein TRFO_34673 [Tritrichomonas foetus]